MKKKIWFYKSLSSVLLFSYFAFLSFPLFHSLAHSNQEENQHSACTIENENDSCHQFIYHNNEEANCEHSGHLIEYEDHCTLCAVVTSPEPQVSIDDVTLNLSICTHFELLYLEEFILSFDFFNEDVRGPPLTCV